MEGFVSEKKDFELDALWNGEPVECSGKHTQVCFRFPCTSKCGSYNISVL